VALWLLVPAAWPALAQTIQTVAGGTGGSGVAATQVAVLSPSAVAIDSQGNQYIAAANVVYRVDATSGQISTVAGNGTPGFSGDGAAAISAQLNPRGMAVDGAGNLYIADQGNHRIRKVDAAGQISTVAGNGAQGFSGDGGAATSAQLRYPTDVAVDSAGNLYIADQSNHRIRKVDVMGQISTVAGNGAQGYGGDGAAATSAQLANPTGVAADGAGNLYIADISNQRIRKVDATGQISTVAGNGTHGYGGDGAAATSAQLAAPTGVVVDAAGNLYIADQGNHRIRKVDATGQISTVAGNGTTGFSGDGGAATSAQLLYPASVAADGAGNLYIADQSNQRIRKVDATGQISTVAGNGTTGFSGDGGAATSAQLLYPASVAADGAGNLYIADQTNHRIRKVAATGQISTVAGVGTSGFSGDGAAATSAQLASPTGVAVDGAGNLYIADQSNHRIRKVDVMGQISTVAGNGAQGYGGDDAAATSTALYLPTGVTADGAGNLYIADTSNQRIRKVDATGQISTVAGTGIQGFSGDGAAATSAQLANPRGVAVDGAGNLYIADTSNQRIRKVDATGQISTVAGNGTLGFSGDGAAAISAQLFFPTGVAVDGAGNVYVADQSNHRIRKVGTSLPTAPTGVGALPGAPGSGQVQVTWAAPAANGGSPLISYTVTTVQDPGKTCTATGTPPATTCTVGGLANASQYTFTVTATSGAGTGAASSASAAVILQGAQAISFTPLADRSFGSPVPPLSASVTSPLTVGFASSTPAVCAVAGTTVTLAAAGTCTITATQPGNAFWAAAVPVPQSFTVTPVAPGAPTNVQATPVGSGQVRVTWAPPANTGGGITGYVVTAQPGGQTCTPVPATATTCTFTGLNPGQTYTFTVQASNGAGSAVSPAASNPATPLANSKAFSAPSPTGSGPVAVAVSGGGATCAFESVQLLSAASASAPADRNFPHGVLDFVLNGCDTSTVTVEVTYPSTLPQGGQYWKRRSGTWAPFAGAALAGNKATLTLVDGGSGDDDGAQNGRIVDPGGVAVLAAAPGPGGAASIPTLGDWELMLLATILGLLAWRRRV